MRVVAEEEMREFLAKDDHLRLEGRKLRFDYPEAKALQVNFLCLEPHQLVYLARLVAQLRYEELDFMDAALWLTNFRAGNDRV
jgi:hypothetical protein